MSTSNFGQSNFPKIYAIIEPDDADDFYYEDMKANIIEDLIEHDAYLTNYQSNKGTYLCTFRVTKEWVCCEASLEAHVILIAGYYSGAYFDVEFEEDSTLAYGYWERCVDKFLAKTKSKLLKKIERIIKPHSTPLVVQARASNGETFYKKA